MVIKNSRRNLSSILRRILRRTLKENLLNPFSSMLFNRHKSLSIIFLPTIWQAYDPYLSPFQCNKNATSK